MLLYRLYLPTANGHRDPLLTNAGVAIDQLEDIVTALLAGHVVRAHAAKDWGQAQLLPGTMTCLPIQH